MAATLALAAVLIWGDPVSAGIAYFGVACSAVFVHGGDYRVRAVLVTAQAGGAITGMMIGALVPSSSVAVVAAAMVVGAVAGAVGRIGPGATAFAMMAVIGVAYTQFGRLGMPWWQPALLYLAGSAALLAVSLLGALTHPERYRRRALADVFLASADVVRAAHSDPGGDPPVRAGSVVDGSAGDGSAGDRSTGDSLAGIDAARHRLALASAVARQAVGSYRTARPQRLDGAWVAAQEAAARAAAVAADPRALDHLDAGEVVRDWEASAVELRKGDARAAPPADATVETSPGSQLPGPELMSVRRRIRIGVAVATSRESRLAGARLALCVGAATLLALSLHTPQHAYWIPLTIATVVRPEYAPVLVRVLHRLVGTVLGVALVAAVITLAPGPAALATCAAAALGLAVLAGPRLYGLAVVGITGSALFSIAVGDPDGLEPWIRLGDTVLGCLIALLLGVLAWPARGLPDQQRALAAAADAVARQIVVELDPGADGAARSAARLTSYQLAHGWRAEVERDQAELDPGGAARDWLPVTLELERLVDAVCAASARVRSGGPVPSPADRAEILTRLRQEPPTAQAARQIIADTATAVARLGRDGPGTW